MCRFNSGVRFYFPNEIVHILTSLFSTSSVTSLSSHTATTGASSKLTFSIGGRVKVNIADEFRRPGVEFFCDVEEDPFMFMQENKKLYGFTISMYEFQRTVPTLWEATKGKRYHSSASSGLSRIYVTVN